MGSAWRQLRLIVWKNYLTRKRQKLRLATEIIWPLSLFVLMMWVRQRGLRDFIAECHVTPRVLPSSGFIPFFQNWLCTLNNTCHRSPEEAVLPPVQNLSAFIEDIIPLWGNLENNFQQVVDNGLDGRLLADALAQTSKLADLSQRITSPNYTAELVSLQALLFNTSSIPSELFTKKVNLTPSIFESLLDFKLSNKTYIFSPISLIINESIECRNLTVTLADSEKSVHAHICQFNPEELKSFTSVLDNHWNSSFDKSLVEKFIQADLERSISLFDLVEANNLRRNLSSSSEAFSSITESAGPGGFLLQSLLGGSDRLDVVQKVVNYLNQRFCGQKLPEPDEILKGTKSMDDIKDKYNVKTTTTHVYDNHTTAECNSVFQTIESNSLLRIFWKSYKHLILGQVLYTPVTSKTDRIMKRVNETYFQFHLYRNVFEKVASELSRNRAFLQRATEQYLSRSAANLNSSQKFLRSKIGKVLEFSDDTNSTAHLLQNLKNGEEVLNRSLERQITAESLWQCFEYNKVRGIKDLSTAEDVAGSLLQNDRLWALVIFESEFETEDRRSGNSSFDRSGNWSFNRSGNWSFDANSTLRVRRSAPGAANGKASNMLPNQPNNKGILKEAATSKGDSNADGNRSTTHSFNPRTVYTIRMSSEFVDNTEALQDRLDRPGGRFRPLIDIKYISFGFAYLQDMIEKSIITEQTGTPLVNLPGTMLQQYPYPCYIDDLFIRAVSRMFPMFMVLAWIFTCAMIVKSIVHEKEMRLKQTMQVMGLRNWVFWIGWVIDSLVPMAVVVLLLTVVLVYGKVLLYSDPTVILVFLLLYAMCTIFFSFLISTFFSKANIAAACGGILFFIFYLPYPFMVRWILNFTPFTKCAMCLMSNVALGLGAAYMAEFEEQGVGVTWNNVGLSPVYSDDFNLSYIMIMMIVDCFLYMVLTWYIDAVFPGQYGIPHPWYFPVSYHYWTGKHRGSNKPGNIKPDGDRNGILHPSTASGDPHPGSSQTQENFESEPNRLYAGVQIHNLTKVYRNGKVAVNSLSMNFYEDQITSFLGHNGAGKTTTISILTGLYPPTSGTAYICGYDIRSDMTLIRKNLGMCPQHNVLFSRLTVIEHLQFYGFLRGSNKQKEVEAEFEQMLNDLDLPDKKQSFPSDLSGGMQRKLSIAAAFIGGSKVVILDEPTSGVDPYSRRSIWELLLKYKKGRTVILTTHYMDEADLLGDRIGIISKGSMKCCGTSMFLKKKFGSGYTLTIELNPRTPGYLTSQRRPSGGSEYSSLSPAFEDEHAVTQVVKQYIPGANIESNFGNEIVFSLPTKDSNKLETLCSQLDDDLARLNAVSYGVSDSSLEEIFLKITDDENPEDQVRRSLTRFLRDKLSRHKHPADRRDGKVVRLKGANVTYSQVPVQVGGVTVEKKTPNKYIRQFFALHAKRFHHTKRNFKGLFSELILPPVLVAFALAVLSVLPSLQKRPPLEITPLQYGEDIQFFAKDIDLTYVPEDYHKSIYDEMGLGTACLFWKGTSPCNPKAVFIDNPSYKMPSCSCETGAHICQKPIDDPPPPHHKIVSNYSVYDMNGLDPNQWIVSTLSKYKNANLGGFEFGANLTTLNKPGVVTWADLKTLLRIRGLDEESLSILPDDNRPESQNIKVWFNNKAWIASVANLNAIHNNLLRVHVEKNGTLHEPLQDYGIILINHPMSFTSRQLDAEIARKSGFSLLESICVIFALSFVTASFLLYLIEDRISNSKHLQLVSGVDRLTYWVQAFTWDLAAYSVSATLCILVFIMFDAQAYISREHVLPFVILFLLYGWACIPMMYPFSFVFDIPSSAFVGMGCGNMFIGIITTISTSVLQSFPDEDLRIIASYLSEIFLIFPHFCLGDGMIKLSVNYFSKVTLGELGIIIHAEVWDWNFLGKNMACMLSLGIIFFLITLMIEFKVFRACTSRFTNFVDRCTEKCLQGVARRQAKAREEINMDIGVGDEEDVALERRRVQQNPSDLLIIKDLVKKYRRKKTPSVNKICVGVRRGECFGLLGLNGAGKTTTFKMLTGAIKPTSGDASIGGHSITESKGVSDVRSLLGYCPQFDALDPLLTVYEQLVFYARVRNIPPDAVPQSVDRLISRMNLGQYRDRLAGDLSGGNKRKLSTAIALLGNPPLVFLDEPTTGMDPKARRFLWNCISEIVKEGGCVILTSHSMEECQALCSRLTIMVNGQFMCLGSSQHLKNKYGKGYALIIRCADDAKEEVKTFIANRLSASKLAEEHYNQLRYEIPQARLSSVLKEMEKAKSNNIVVDYSVSQTTLEDVFIRFAREQSDPNDTRPKSRRGGFGFGDCFGKAKHGKHVSPKPAES